jgi:putative colanic acid biosynthesis UDP-glucose lipid carrier transferase
MLRRNSFTLTAAIEAFLGPITVVITLLSIAHYYDDRFGSHYLVLCALSFALTFPGDITFHEAPRRAIRKLVISWLLFVGVMTAFGVVTNYIYYFPQRILLDWAIATPFTYAAAYALARVTVLRVISKRNHQRDIVVVGVNEIGIRLAQQFADNPYLGTRVVAFFDDRGPERISATTPAPIVGRLSDLAGFVNRHTQIKAIYFALPMTTQPRILTVLDDLKDSTASIYFVPDIFVTDLIQGRLDSVGDMPVVAVCETPFTGLNGLMKRASDIMISSLIVLLVSPLLLALAVGVKLSSPGPIIFKQRRYGLDGKEILIYKFRSMTTCDDGAVVKQATKNDRRITRFGSFIRKTSLDELPQFLNVLQGRMSIVGPRPHAIAHNETYRKVIKGYMIRHKVRPGITGWAQVNGCRGETSTLEKMGKRVEYDLEYLRNWSLSLDLWIITKTMLVVFRDENAY